MEKNLKNLRNILTEKKSTLEALLASRIPGEHGARRSIRRAEAEVEAAQAAYNEAYKADKAEKAAKWQAEKFAKEMGIVAHAPAVETNPNSRPAKRRAARRQIPNPTTPIKRFVVETNQLEDISVFGSAAVRKLNADGIDVSANVMKITSVVKSRESAEIERIATLMQHYAAAGYVTSDAEFVPLMAAASDTRKGQATWMNRKYAGAYWTWSMCGLKLSDISGKIAINKYMAYQGLLWSASKTFRDIFGVEIKPERIVVVDDKYIEVSGIVDVVDDQTGEVQHGVLRTIPINAFDGQGAIRAELTDGESCTIRAPWVKAFVQASNWDEVLAWFMKKFNSTKIKTLYGERDLKDVDIVLTKSCFKAAKLYESWEAYEKAFVELGHELAVCVREHKPHIKGMPYQQGQTLQGNDDDVEYFAQHSLATIEKYKDMKEAVGLLSGYQKMVAMKYPALLKEPETAQVIQDKIASRKRSMMGGRIPELGYNAFGAADMKAFWEAVAGVEIEGSLKAGECALLRHDEGLVDVTRSPHLDNAHVLLYNVHKMPFVPEKSPTLFVNVFDLTTIRLRCDYDGDHFWYSQNERLIDLVKRTSEILANLPIDWTAPESEKGTINKATIVEYIASLLKGSEIGLYADALTKMWAHGYNHDVCCWLTYAGNVLIDAAKHGNVKIDKPDAVKDLDNASLPLFAMYAKADDDRPVGKYWTEWRITIPDGNGQKKVVYESEYKGNGEDILSVRRPRAEYSGSFLDRYSKRVQVIVPDKLDIEGLDNMVFDPAILMANPERKTGKLGGVARKPEWNESKNRYDADCIFEQIAFRHSAEWKERIKDKDFVMNFQEWIEFKTGEAQRELIEWARAQYAGNEEFQKWTDDMVLEALCDIVIRRIFSRKKQTAKLDKVVKSAFWMIFGEVVYRNVCRNLEEEAMSFDAEEEFHRFIEEMGFDED